MTKRKRPKIVKPRITVIARNTDPDTSHEAADNLEKQQTKLQESVTAVVSILEKYGPMTDFEIRSKWPEVWEKPWSFTLPCKARHWAREAGLVRRDGYGQHNGRRVLLWALGKDEEFLLGRPVKEN